MSNDTSENDPKPTEPDPQGARGNPPPAAGDVDDAPFELSDLPDLAFAAPLNEDDLESGLEALPEPVAPPDVEVPEWEMVSFDTPIAVDDPGAMTIGVSLEDLPDLASVPEVTGLSGVIPPAEPASGIPLASEPGSSVVLGPPSTGAYENSEAVGNLEPVAPVEPASGWLDTEDAPPAPADGGLLTPPLEVHQADLFEAPPAIESSDIFSSGPVPRASATDQSDVIAATAYGQATSADPNKPPRPSEVALSFDQPPGGSTIQHEGESGELPVAEELPDSSENLFDAPATPQPYDSSKLSTTPILPVPVGDAPEYGSTPFATPDASSILADLGGPGEITLNDSSSVRLESPGVERTLSIHPQEGTEFDLTITDDPPPPGLAATQDSGGTGEATDWREQSGSDLFADARTAAEIDLDAEFGRVNPVNPDLTADEPSLTSSPSSIFSGEKVAGSPTRPASGPGSDSVRIGTPPDEEDAAVEFSDHPSADPEASSAALLGPPSPAIPPKPAVKRAFELPQKPTPADDASSSGMVDWSTAATADNDEATMGFPHANLEAPPSGILKRGGKPKPEEPDEETPARAEPDARDKSKPGKPRGTKLSKTKPAPGSPDGTDPSVEIDWMAGSSSEEAVVVAESVADRPSSKAKDKGKDRGKDKGRPTPSSLDKKKSGGGWIGGTLLGMVIAGGACAGVYFGGVVPNSEKTAQVPPPGNQTVPPAVPEGPAPLTVADARSALGAGDPARALKVLQAVKDAAPEKVTTETKAATGEALLFAKIQELSKTNVNFATRDDAELKKAREDLQAVVDDAAATKTPEGDRAAVKALIHLGVTHELAGERDEAKKTYEDGMKKFPKYAATFQGALDRLAATAPTTDGTSRRITPVEARQLLFTVLLLQADGPARDEDAEAGTFFWKAVKLARDGEYAKAIDEIKLAKAAHVKQAKALAGRGLNPLSDPLEQIFPRCCDDLRAYWELRAAIYAHKPIADLIKKDGIDKAMTELASAQKKAIEAVKLMADLKEANDNLTVAAKDLKDAKEELTRKQKLFLDAEAKAKADFTAIEEKFTRADRERKAGQDLIAALAKELQAARLLPEKYDATALLAAQKAAADRATGPTLTALVSPGMMAIGGSGLSAAQLIDLAERLTKAEATAKIATDKLAAETKRLTTEHAAEVKKLNDVHTADVKKLTDEYATETKKLMEVYAANTTKLKADQAAEVKKMADKFAIDFKKLTDDNTMAVKKLTEGFEGKIKNLEENVVKEKAAGEAVAAKLRIDLGNAVSPAQALDLWLPQLTELRRPADADPALANATKVLATAPADSEDAAKARTVAGLALLLKGDLQLAKAMFEAALSSPAHKAAVGKEWAKVAIVGRAAIDDPLAPYRLPVENPKRNPRVAARFLDAGITAYKAGRYSEAATALGESTKADPTDPIAWYFLGATRWEMGSVDQAKEDYRQGGEWEKLSVLSARAISGSLSPIQGAARDALSLARP